MIFLDELPWMELPKADFMAAPDDFWNSWGQAQKDVVLIVCGLASSWVIPHIPDDTGGRYNRAARVIRLLPFTQNECEEFFIANGCSAVQDADLHVPQIKNVPGITGGERRDSSWHSTSSDPGAQIDLL